MTDCPICGQPCKLGITRHVWEAHFEGHQRSIYPYAFCWCGALLSLERASSPHTHDRDIARHMRDHGGLQAHWLAHALALSPESSP